MRLNSRQSLRQGFDAIVWQPRTLDRMVRAPQGTTIVPAGDPADDDLLHFVQDRSSVFCFGFHILIHRHSPQNDGTGRALRLPWGPAPRQGASAVSARLRHQRQEIFINNRLIAHRSSAGNINRHGKADANKESCSVGSRGGDDTNHLTVAIEQRTPELPDLRRVNLDQALVFVGCARVEKRSNRR